METKKINYKKILYIVTIKMTGSHIMTNIKYTCNINW